MKSNKKLAIITGGASGIGYYTAQHLAMNGYHVILGVRNIKKGEQSALKIKMQSVHAEVDVLPLDVSDLQSITAFVDEVTWRYGSIEILLHNAGIMAAAESRTNDGFDFEMATNFIGPFLLSNMLLPSINNKTGRIITITSDEYEKVTKDDLLAHNLLERKPGTDPMRWYGITKLYALMFSVSLQHRLKQAGSEIIALTAHPGLAGTNLASNIPSAGTRFFMRLGMKLMGQSAKNGARSFLHAAMAENVEGGQLWAPGGFGGMRGAPVPKMIRHLAEDALIAEKLWHDAELLTGRTFILN